MDRTEAVNIAFLAGVVIVLVAAFVYVNVADDGEEEATEEGTEEGTTESPAMITYQDADETPCQEFGGDVSPAPMR